MPPKITITIAKSAMLGGPMKAGGEVPREMVYQAAAHLIPLRGTKPEPFKTPLCRSYEEALGAVVNRSLHAFNIEIEHSHEGVHGNDGYDVDSP